MPLDQLMGKVTLGLSLCAPRFRVMSNDIPSLPLDSARRERSDQEPRRLYLASSPSYRVSRPSEPVATKGRFTLRRREIHQREQNPSKEGLAPAFASQPVISHPPLGGLWVVANNKTDAIPKSNKLDLLEIRVCVFRAYTCLDWPVSP